jgi:hypothetical protein
VLGARKGKRGVYIAKNLRVDLVNLRVDLVMMRLKFGETVDPTDAQHLRVERFGDVEFG